MDSCPGLGLDCAGWLRDQGIALAGADNIAVEAFPAPDGAVMPLHIAAIRDSGIYLLELLDLEDLARRGVTGFLLVVAPLNIAGGVGSPVARSRSCDLASPASPLVNTSVDNASGDVRG